MCLAIPGKILSISGDDPLTRMGKIDFSGVVKQANVHSRRILGVQRKVRTKGRGSGAERIRLSREQSAWHRSRFEWFR